MCQLPDICDPRTRRCQAPPTICESDIDCPNEQVCDLSVEPHLCTQRIPDCLNDLLEGDRGNDTFATPAVLDPSIADFEELKVCPGDTDWYRLELTEGQTLRISLLGGQTPDALQDPYITLHGPDGAEIASDDDGG